MRELRELWKRILLRGVHVSHKYRHLDTLYVLKDPWDMESEREQFRFRNTARIIQNNIGHVHTMLEIGCGEGHQSITLTHLCDQLTGIDISQRAISRARFRVPAAEYHAGDIFTASVLPNERGFDVVLACEVLSYLPDVPGAIRRLDALGDWKFVTFWDGHESLIRPAIEAIEGIRFDRFAHESTVWHAAWWRGSS